MGKPFLLGLTGSIGMGKSTTAEMFSRRCIPVWSADAAVHRLYAKGGAAVAPMAAEFPDAIVDGAVSRDRLKTIISKDQTALKKIEAIVHPLVSADRQALIDRVSRDIVVLDIPLLFETGQQDQMDAVVVVTAPPEVQRERVLDREGMSEDQFNLILSKQMPDIEKRGKADYIIETTTLAEADRAVQAVLDDIWGDRDGDAGNSS